MTDRATCWSLTINNPTPSDEEGIALARQKGWSVEGQLEKGAEGTLHYQLMLKTPQVRFSAVKKAFPRAHIEVARNPKALSQYVSKQDTRQQELPKSQELFPSLSKFWDLIYHRISASEWFQDTAEGPDDFPDMSDANSLIILDETVSGLIEEGYHVESLAVNPQIRSSWKLYRNAIFRRSWRSHISQTDRQTDNSRLESEVSVPVVEYNNADDDTRTEGGLQSPCGDEASGGQSDQESPSSSYEGCTESSDSSVGEEDDF